MSKTVVGFFSTTAQAEKVKQTLIADGYSASDIKIVAKDQADGSSEGIGHKIGSFFSSLVGSDDATHEHYTQGVAAGGALLSVDADAADADQVAAILSEYGARQVEGNTGSQQAFTGSTATANTTGEVIPIVEEQLVVGKREVDRGGVRVFSRVVENPVSADVTLRDEFINVERRTVDRPATAADFQTGSESFELRASGEEAVVGKTSRVVEEVLVGKEASQRTEAIHDTVRRTEVDVEDLATTGTTTGTATTTGTTTGSLVGGNIDKDRF